jgi:hypothetical protein
MGRSAWMIKNFGTLTLNCSAFIIGLPEQFSIFNYTGSKSKMISRRLGGGDEAYCEYTLRKPPTTTPTKIAL